MNPGKIILILFGFAFEKIIPRDIEREGDTWIAKRVRINVEPHILAQKQECVPTISQYRALWKKWSKGMGAPIKMHHSGPVLEYYK